jgi:hypothetical protein
MKSFKVLFLLAFALLLASPAFALQCKDGNYAASDECWTEVRVSISETTRVIPGTVLTYTNTDTAEKNAFEVRVASTSTDYMRVAGVAQSTIATGDSGRVLVRGAGKLRIVDQSVNASGDYLYLGKGAGSAAPTAASSRDQALAFSRQTTASAATIDAFIVVV